MQAADKTGGAAFVADDFTKKLSGSFAVYSPRLSSHNQINNPEKPYTCYIVNFDITRLTAVSMPKRSFAFELTDAGFERLFYWFEPLYELYLSGD